MRILHLAAGNRWTGAAAPAFAEAAALREAGVDAHYAYVGGYKLEQKLARVDFAHATIAKAQTPMVVSIRVRLPTNASRWSFVTLAGVLPSSSCSGWSLPGSHASS